MPELCVICLCVTRFTDFRKSARHAFSDSGVAGGAFLLGCPATILEGELYYDSSRLIVFALRLGARMSLFCFRNYIRVGSGFVHLPSFGSGSTDLLHKLCDGGRGAMAAD